MPSGSVTLEAFERHSDCCLDGLIIRQGDYPAACGGHADIWKGRLFNRGVAVKVLRPWSNTGKRIQQDRLLKRLWREYIAWSSLSHPNVIELLGFSYDFSPDWFVLPSLISPWMSNGTVDSYIENNQIADRLLLLQGIAEGLAYLHRREPAIIHGDLRAGNVLVSDSGAPCLSDFGLSRVLSETSKTPTSSDPAGSLRWMSPELFGNDGSVSVHSDVWAYGMTLLEILTGDRPYSASKSDAYVFGQITDGHTPSRPEDPEVLSFLTDDLWDICCQCWSFQPMERPSMREVIKRISVRMDHELDEMLSGSLGESRPPHRSHSVISRQTVDLQPAPSSPFFLNSNSLSVPRNTDPANPARKQLAALQPHGSPRSTSHVSNPATRSNPGNVMTSSARLRALAGLEGIPELEFSVEALFKCYDALDNVKVYKRRCKQLHARCVDLLLALKIRIRSAGSEDDLAAAEDTIEEVLRKFSRWSTWSRIRATFRIFRVRDRLRELNEKITRLNNRLLVQLSTRQDPRTILLEEPFQQTRSRSSSRRVRSWSRSRRGDALVSPRSSSPGRSSFLAQRSRFSVRRSSQRARSRSRSPPRSGPGSLRSRYPQQIIIPRSRSRSSRAPVLVLPRSRPSSPRSSVLVLPRSRSSTSIQGPLVVSQYLRSGSPVTHKPDIPDDHHAHSRPSISSRTQSSNEIDVRAPILKDVFPANDVHCLNDQISERGQYPTASGGYSDVYQGSIEGRIISIKTIRPFWHRVPRAQERRILEGLRLKFDISISFLHPNVLSCFGFSCNFPEPYSFLSLISPWMSNGTLSSYLTRYPDVDSHDLALGIGRGLDYLHTRNPPVIYGDVRTENMLVSDSGVPCLSGLRLSEVFKHEGVNSTADLLASLRWMAPELLREDTESDLGSDVWAYGMTVLEMASRKPPYQELKEPAAVLRHIRNGNIPSRTTSSIHSDAMWEMCLECWTVDAPQRPSMHDVLSRFDGTLRPDHASVNSKMEHS